MYNNGFLYGAIQSGFTTLHKRKNKVDKFIQVEQNLYPFVFLLENGNWLLKEVLSFDHNDPSKRKLKAHLKGN
jgi:hypothetical protein